MSLSVNIKKAFYGNKYVLNDINFSLEDNSILAIVGETGAGKTTVAKIVSGMYKFYPLHFDGEVETDKSISFIPQNISEALDPLFTIKTQMLEITKDEELIKKTLQSVGFFDVERILESYPHNLSGGMVQRVLIAMALLKGDILIADEFTSALDRTTKFQIVELFKDLNKRLKKTVIFITHDMELLIFDGLIAVMYMGEIVEFGNVSDIKNNPYHPYTKFLLNSIPKDDMKYTKDRFDEISINKNAKCPFVDICDYVQDVCYKEKPLMKQKGAGFVRCHF